MFERFTERARRVMALANQEAMRFNHEYIGTEHILLGLVKEGSSGGAKMLLRLGVDLQRARLEMVKLVKSGPDALATYKVPLMPRAKNVVEHAIEESRNLNHRRIDADHLLLGLLREPDGVAAQLLLRLGLNLEELRKEALAICSARIDTEEDEVPTALHRATSAHGRFTDRATKVMMLADEEARRLNHEYIGTEHVLLGLVKEGSGVGANVLKNLDVDLHKVRTEVVKLVQAGPDTVPAEKLPQTPRAKKVLEYAIEESKSLNHNYVGTKHLVLGLLRETEGVAAQVLMHLGLKLDEVREEIFNLLDAGVPETEDLPPALAARKDDLIGSGGDLQRAIIEVEGEYCRLLVGKDEAVKNADYDRAVELRDKAAHARLAIDAVREEIGKLRSRLEQIRDELRRG